MTDHFTDHFVGIIEPLDHETCRSICDAIGERLQRELNPKYPAARLERLIEDMRRQESAGRTH